MYLKRNLILYPADEKDYPIIASIECLDNKNSIALHNLNSLFNNQSFVVICNDCNQFFICKVVDITSFSFYDFNISDDLFVFICSFNNTIIQALYFGTNLPREKAKIFFQTNKMLIEKAITNTNLTKRTNTNQTDIVDTQQTKDNTQQQLSIETNTEIQTPIEGNKNNQLEEHCEPTFFEQIKDSLTLLLESYPHNDQLENKIENSIFVTISQQEEKSINSFDYYSVGVLKENNITKYICVAFPCDTNTPPPKEYEQFCQYIQIDNCIGYHLMYQDAITGKNIIINN